MKSYNGWECNAPKKHGQKTIDVIRYFTEKKNKWLINKECLVLKAKKLKQWDTLLIKLAKYFKAENI